MNAEGKIETDDPNGTFVIAFKTMTLDFERDSTIKVIVDVEGFRPKTVISKRVFQGQVS